MKSRIALLISFLTFALFNASATAAGLQESQAAEAEASRGVLEAVPSSVREAMMSGDFERALAAVNELAQKRPEAADTWCWLRGLALVHGAKYAEGAAELQRFDSEFAKSAWQRKATFLRAEALRELRQFAEAESLYENAVGLIQSESRQREMAAIYLDFADALSTASDKALPQEKLDYARAETLYARTLDLDLPRGLVEHASFRRAFCKQRLEDWQGAIQLYRAYIEEFDPQGQAEFVPAGFARSDSADGGALNARYALGLCLVRANQGGEARRLFEDLARRLRARLAEHTGGADGTRRESMTALAGDAEFEAARTWLVSDQAGILLGVAGFRRLLEHDPAHARAQEARFASANALLSIQRSEEALVVLDELLAQSQKASDAPSELREKNARLAQQALFKKGQVLHGQGRLDEAIGVYTTYTRTHTSGEDWDAAQRKILECEYERGLQLREAQSWDAARTTWTRFLDEHPLHERAPELLFAIGELYYREAELRYKAGEALAPATSALYQSAIREWRKLSHKYAGTDHASHALYQIAALQETRLGELEGAIETYRACNFGSYAGNAQQRLWQMTQESLNVRTEQTWRSDERASVLANLRNVEELQVAIYQLDLEAYFRKHLTHRSIEDLDLDLIAPDRQYTLEVTDYERYAALERRIDIPVEGPGVWAIALATETRRATTLLIRSDIDVIVKSSLEEVFVFAEDMRTETPAQDVNVLVAVPSPTADAPPTFHELKTGADGVARLKTAPLASGTALRVLAAREGHYASNGLSLENVGITKSVGERWLVYPSRPAYRPGDEVHWRAILREFAAGKLPFEREGEYAFEVTDAQQRVIDKGNAGLSAFGTLHGELRLDEHAVLGNYTITVRDSAGRMAKADFRVERYQLERIELLLTFDSEVYFCGQEVHATLSAQYYYGEPVADSPIEYALPDGRRGQVRTDSKGKAQLSFDTRDFTQEGPLEVRATLTQERVSVSNSALLALRGFKVSLDVERELFLVGDRFQVEVTTSLPSREPTGRKLELRISRLQSLDGGRYAEVLESTLAFETDAKSGKASLPVQLARGGLYTLRVEGLDRFGNPVVAERRVQISGEDDETRLRILSDVNVARVGENLVIDLHNRAGKGLALLTLEGESVLEYQLLHIEPGHNSVSLTVRGKHVPNFVVAAAMMRAHEFFEAHADFIVERKLSIQVVPDQKIWAPGDEAVVAMTVTDALGEPVSAELSLAIVDESLFESFPDGSAPIETFFQPARREWAALRTATSCGFTYVGATREVAAEVLEEARREDAQLTWDALRAQTLGTLVILSEGDAKEINTYRGPGDSAPQAPGIATASENSLIGLGGGAGGATSGRFGGRRKLSTKGDGDAKGMPNLNDDLAYWSPSIVTDAEGKATIRFAVPERSTRWRLTCRGVDQGTGAGEARETFLSRSEFFVEVLAPEILTEGDQLRPRVRIHNLTGETGEAALTFTARFGGQELQRTARIELGAGRIMEHEFDLSGQQIAGTSASFTIEAAAQLGTRELAAQEELELQVRPWGVAVSDFQSGTLTSEVRIDLQLDEDAALAGRTLELYLASSNSRALIDAALDRAGLRTPYACGALHADAASDLSGLCAVLRSLERAGGAQDVRLIELRERAQALVARLSATQLEDGGWNWSGSRPVSQTTSRPGIPVGSHRESTCRALGALAEARALGFDVAPKSLASARAYLDKAFTALSHADDELKAMILEAESRAGAADFSAVNRLHRVRESLSPAALAYTTRTLVRMGRLPMALEVAAVLEQIAALDAGSRTWSIDKNLPWNRSSLEMRALALLALMESGSTASWIPSAVDELWAQAPWFPLRTRGVVIAALAENMRWSASHETFRVGVTVDGELVETLDFSPQSAGRTLRVEVPQVAKREVSVGLRLEGRGTPHYKLKLSGISTQFERGTVEGLRLRQADYFASPPMYSGRPIPTGFDVTQDLDSNERWENYVSQLPLGSLVYGQVRFGFSSRFVPEEDRSDYYLLEIPLPAGARLLEGSLVGRYESFEERPGSLLVQVGQVRDGVSFVYTLIGAHGGDWRVNPPVLRSAYEPDRFFVGKPQALKILRAGEVSEDKYRPTPDEMFHLGKAHYDDKKYEQARQLLSTLYTQFNGVLREKNLRETAEMLLFLAIRAKDAPTTVSFFEVLREKNPELVVPLEDVLAVGRAYRELGEFERALLIFKAVLDESFGKDLKVAGTLEEQGELAGSMETLERLWLEYPDSPAVRATYLALADKRLSKAPKAHEDRSLRAAGFDRAYLSLHGILGLQRFLAFYPEDPLAAGAALNLVNAHLEIEDYAQVDALCTQMGAIYTKAPYADAFEYSRAVAQWYLGKDDSAQELLMRIAASTYVDERGVLHPSLNRDLAYYILAQINHARRKYDVATSYYERIVDQFSDAREVLQEFREKRIQLPEVTNTRLGKRTEVELAHANVDEVEVLAYRVDLMTLYLREKNLSAVTQVNLAGISPSLRVKHSLRNDEGPEDLRTKLELDLDQAGAYLIICRGAELHASGLVLVTDIDLDVREDPTSGRLRVTAVDLAKASYLSGLDVRVVGSESGTVLRGATDRRGLFVADGVGGVATIIARSEEGEYAFYRGKQSLGQPRTATLRDQADAQYFKNVLELNSLNVDLHDKQLQQEIDRDRGGLQINFVK